MNTQDTALDIAHSAGTGIAKGAIGLAGLPGDIGSLLSAGVDAAGHYLGADPARLQAAKEAVSGPISRIPSPLTALTGPGAADIQKGVEGYTGQFYQPQTTLGQGAQTIGEFVPASLAGPGGIARRLVTGAVLPGAASEAAGQVTEGTPLEPYARAGAALATGGITALASPGRTLDKALLSQLPEYVTPADVQRAGALIQHAQSLSTPVPLSWAQALTRVTGRPVLQDMQRILESARPSRTRMQDFFAPQAQQFESAARQEVGRLAPAPVDPNTVGPSIQQAAEKTIEDMRAAMTKATKPLYDKARQTLVPQMFHDLMMQDPLFADALRVVRNDTAKSYDLRGLSDRNAVVYDAVKQELRERSERASAITDQNRSQRVAGVTGRVSTEVKDFATATTRGPGGTPGPLEQALSAQTAFREKYLNPLLQGPIGKLAAKDLTTQKAIEALFPSAPLADSQTAISRAVSDLAKRNSTAAEQLVRAHVMGTLNQAATSLQGGVNPAVGGKFFVKLVGNPQQRANMQAAVEALPNGKARWQGTEKLLDVAQATALRMNKGSLTAFNPEDIQALGSGTNLSEAFKTALSPSLWTRIVNDKVTKWQVGKNLDGLVSIITDPKSGPLLQRLAGTPRNSNEAGAIAARLMLLGDAATTKARQPLRVEQPQETQTAGP
jgi:hypothetical protein